MKSNITLKQLTLFLGIAVALIVLFMLVTSSQTFEAAVPSARTPALSLPNVANVVLQKVVAFF